MAGSIRAQIKLEGGKEFANEFNHAASAIKSANAELGYFTTELKANGKSQDALQGRTQALQNAFQAEQNVIDSLTKRIEELNNMTGQDTTQAVDELTAELYKHKAAQAQLGDQIDDTTQDFSEFGKEVGTTSALVSKAVDLAIGFAKVVWDIGKSAVEYNMQMESYSKTIEAFFKTSGQTAEEAAKNTAELLANQKELSAQIGLGADKLIDANKMMIASGVNGERSQEAVEALAKSIVAVGGGNEEFSRMASNLAQIQSVGKAAAADMKQFSMAGVDVYSLISEQTGITVEKLHEMDISFDMIVDAMTAATSEGGKFYEASQAGATTLQGQINVLQSNIREGLGTAFQPFNDMLANDVIPNLLEISENIDWDALGEMMADAAKVASDAFGTLVETLGYLAEAYVTVKDAIDDWGNVGERVVNDISQNYLGTAGAFKQAYDEQNRFTEGTSTGLKKVEDASSEVNKVIAGMPVAWIEAAPLAQGVGEDIADAVSSPIKDLENQAPIWMDHFGTELSDSLAAQAPKFGAAASELAKAAQDYLGFSVPDKGPLHEYETWMPDFVSGLARTMTDSEWMLADASADLAQTITNNTVTNNISMSVYGQNGQSADRRGA